MPIMSQVSFEMSENGMKEPHGRRQREKVAEKTVRRLSLQISEVVANTF